MFVIVGLWRVVIKVTINDMCDSQPVLMTCVTVNQC